MLRGFAHTDRGIAFAGAGTIGTELKVEQHFASYADDGDTNVGLIRREALLTFITLNHISNINIQPLRHFSFSNNSSVAKATDCTVLKGVVFSS